VNDETNAGEHLVTIKKYANRRLYNTATSSYVTLDDLAEMVKQGTDFEVKDAKSGDDITRSVLTQIIFDEESKSGQNLLPIRFLRQLIRFYGDNMQALVPRYLEFSIELLTREQEKLRAQIEQAFGGDPFKAMEEQTRQNMVLFEKAMSMFNPFAATGEDEQGMPQSSQPRGGQSGAGKGESQDDLTSLREQLAAMQQQIDALAGRKKE